MYSGEKIARVSNGFYRIYGFMENELMLRGSELRVYALIFSFTLGDLGMYYGTRKYLAKTLMLSERTVYRALSSLTKRGLIENVFDEMSGRSGIRCSYMKEAERKGENSEFIEKVSEKALDNMVEKKYGKLPEALHLATRAAIRDRIEREARKKEIDTLVREVRSAAFKLNPH